MPALTRLVIPPADLRLGDLHCGRAVVSCIDFRFWKHDQRFLEELGDGPFDYIKVAGAAKNFLKEPHRTLLVGALRTVCCEQHRIRQIIVLNHWDCAAYGFSRSFPSAFAEEQAHLSDLHAAGAVLAEEFPGIEITLAYSMWTDVGLEYRVVGDAGR